jgi:plastocyanin
VRLFASVLLVLCVFLVGCGGDDDGGSSSGGDNVVQMTADSFDPATLTIKTGDTVEFENESGEDKWPASNVHPTHELYPGFDAEKSILDGDSYEFTFDRAGRWGYHDHLNPDIQGTIVVE